MAQGEIRAILAALAAQRVRFLVVGGVAVVLHGYPRLTVDLDIVLALDPENVRAALKALSALGYQPRAPVPAEALADASERERWFVEKDMKVFTLWSPEMPGTDVDIFIQEPFPVADMLSRAERVRLGDLTVMVAAIEDLIAMKQLAARPQDLEDIRALEEVVRLKRERSREQP